MERADDAGSSTPACRSAERASALHRKADGRGLKHLIACLDPGIPCPRPVSTPACRRPSGLFRSHPRRVALVERCTQFRRRHRQIPQPQPRRVGNRVSNCRHRRHDRDLADAACAKRMPWVRHLDQDRVDHRQVGANRHAVVEEAWVLQAAVLVVDVFLIERPADALRHTALHLALNIRGMYGPAHILDRRVA